MYVNPYSSFRTQVSFSQLDPLKILQITQSNVSLSHPSPPQTIFSLIVSGHYPSFILTPIISLYVYLFNVQPMALSLLASYVYHMCFIYLGISPDSGLVYTKLPTSVSS